MNNKEQHIRDLLRRWTTGEITAREEAELLAAAQQDPFLQEALAAYQGQTEHDHAVRLDRIRRETTSQRLPVKRSIGRWTAIAASMLLLITAGWWALRQQSTLDRAPVAMEKSTNEQQYTTPANEEVPVAKSAPAAEMEEEVGANEPFTPSDSNPVAGRAQETTPDKEESVAPTAPPASYAAEALAAESLAKDRAEQREKQRTVDLSTRRSDSEAIALQAEEVVEADALPAATPPPPPPPPPAPTAAPKASPSYPTQNQAYARSLDNPTRISNSGVPEPAQGYRIVEGYVTDNEGFPLIGASVLGLGSSYGTVTDLDGFYRITIPENIGALLVSYTGFESMEINILDEDRLDIALAEGMALDEVVVTGLGAKKRQATATSPGIAQPLGGFQTLRDHIAANTPANTPRARIKVRFLVQADGRLTDFAILKSTNVGQNNLAIQLLQDGPVWEITEGDAPVEAEYVVKF